MNEKIKKKCSLWESEDEGASIVLKIFLQQMHASQNIYIQGDRELQGLSEYGITFVKVYLNTKNIPKKLTITIFFQGYIYLLPCIYLLKNNLSTVNVHSIKKYRKSAFFLELLFV